MVAKHGCKILLQLTMSLIASVPSKIMHEISQVVPRVDKLPYLGMESLHPRCCPNTRKEFTSHVCNSPHSLPLIQIINPFIDLTTTFINSISPHCFKITNLKIQ